MNTVDTGEMTQLHMDGIIRETKKDKPNEGAYLILFGDKKSWIPKSQSRVIDTYDVDVAFWLMEKHNLQSFMHKDAYGR